MASIINKSIAFLLCIFSFTYCNDVLYGVSSQVIRRLQMVLNAAAHLVVGVGRNEHITPANTVQSLRLTMSMSTHLPTSTTSATQSLAFPVGQIFVWQNATTCLSHWQEHSSADGVSMLQPQPSGTCFRHSSAHHPLVVDSFELGFSSHRPMYTSENFCWRAYCFTFYICLLFDLLLLNLCQIPKLSSTGTEDLVIIVLTYLLTALCLLCSVKEEYEDCVNAGNVSLSSFLCTFI